MCRYAFAFQKRNELEKQLARFEREVSAAKKSRCEQNLFSVICLDLIAAIGMLLARKCGKCYSSMTPIFIFYILLYYDIFYISLKKRLPYIVVVVGHPVHQLSREKFSVHTFFNSL